MLDFILEHWFIEAIVCIVAGGIVVYALCWFFDQINKGN